MRIQIIGKGNVGFSFYLFLKEKGYDVRIYSRRFGGDISPSGDILFIATKDKEIKETAEKFRDLDYRVFAHFSGSLTSDILPTDKERASFHPLQAFNSPDPNLWNGITVVCEGTDKGLEILRKFAESLGLRFKHISPENKVIYHAAAVILSNLIYSPLICADRIFRNLGIDREDYSKLLRTSVENFISKGEGGLTGPIVRGDTEIINMHLKTLKGDAREIYKCLTDFILRIKSKDA